MPKRADQQVSLKGKARKQVVSEIQQRAVAVNSDLREHLRTWRRLAAQKRGIPAFTVMHDTSLDDLCRVQPDSLASLRGVHGFGPRKMELYGSEVLNAIRQFHDGSGAATKKPSPLIHGHPDK